MSIVAILLIQYPLTNLRAVLRSIQLYDYVHLLINSSFQGLTISPLKSLTGHASLKGDDKRFGPVKLPVNWWTLICIMLHVGIKGYTTSATNLLLTMHLTNGLWNIYAVISLATNQASVKPSKKHKQVPLTSKTDHAKNMQLLQVFFILQFFLAWLFNLTGCRSHGTVPRQAIFPMASTLLN